MKNLLLKILLIIEIVITLSCKLSTKAEVDPELGVDPNTVKAYIVTYVTEMGETPAQIALVKGSKLYSEHLPILSVETGYFDFDAWYLDGTKMVAGEYKIESNITLKAKWNFNHYDYEKTDYSMNVFSPTGNSNYSVDGEYTKITVSETSISRYLISKKENGINYQLTGVYGFEFKIKCDSKIKWSGLAWKDKPSDDCYYFEVYGEGSFKVQSNITEEVDGEKKNKWETTIDLKPDVSHIIKEDFNTIKLVPTYDSDFEIYVNNIKVGTIEREELKITPGQIAFCGTATKKGHKGSALFKLLNYSQTK